MNKRFSLSQKAFVKVSNSFTEWDSFIVTSNHRMWCCSSECLRYVTLVGPPNAMISKCASHIVAHPCIYRHKWWENNSMAHRSISGRLDWSYTSSWWAEFPLRFGVNKIWAKSWQNVLNSQSTSIGQINAKILSASVYKSRLITGCIWMKL